MSIQPQRRTRRSQRPPTGTRHAHRGDRDDLLLRKLHRSSAADSQPADNSGAYGGRSAAGQGPEALRDRHDQSASGAVNSPNASLARHHETSVADPTSLPPLSVRSPWASACGQCGPTGCRSSAMSATAKPASALTAPAVPTAMIKLRGSVFSNASPTTCSVTKSPTPAATVDG